MRGTGAALAELRAVAQQWPGDWKQAIRQIERMKELIAELDTEDCGCEHSEECRYADGMVDAETLVGNTSALYAEMNDQFPWED